MCIFFFFFQAEDGIRDLVRSRGLGDVYKRQPMDGQDEMVDILVETYPGNIKHTFGGISVNGCMHMNDEYGAAGVEMTDTWTCFGDPSIMVRTATPELIPVAHDATIDENISTWTVPVSYTHLTLPTSDLV